MSEEKEKEYSVDMLCYNCGHEFRLTKPFGDEIGHYEKCPHCGCQRCVRKNNA